MIHIPSHFITISPLYPYELYELYLIRFVWEDQQIIIFAHTYPYREIFRIWFMNSLISYFGYLFHQTSPIISHLYLLMLPYIWIFPWHSPIFHCIYIYTSPSLANIFSGSFPCCFCPKELKVPTTDSLPSSFSVDFSQGSDRGWWFSSTAIITPPSWRLPIPTTGLWGNAMGEWEKDQ